MASSLKAVIEADELNAVLDAAQLIFERDYNLLNNKPKINNVILKDNKTFEDLGDHILTNSEILQLYKRVKGI